MTSSQSPFHSDPISHLNSLSTKGGVKGQDKLRYSYYMEHSAILIAIVDMEVAVDCGIVDAAACVCLLFWRRRRQIQETAERCKRTSAPNQFSICFFLDYVPAFHIHFSCCLHFPLCVFFPLFGTRLGRCHLK